MLERIVLIAALALIITAVWLGVRAWRAWKVRRLADELPFAGIVPPGRPAIIGFSTPECAECRTRQVPALKRLAAELGAQVTVQSLLAPEHPHLVERLGILTVPATVVLDGAGVVRHINLGFADTTRLTAQLAGISRHPAHGSLSGVDYSGKPSC